MAQEVGPEKSPEPKLEICLPFPPPGTHIQNESYIPDSVNAGYCSK